MAILKCSCASAYQDEKHGVGKRVHNFSPKNSQKHQGSWVVKGWRCTVCCNIKQTGKDV